MLLTKMGKYKHLIQIKYPLSDCRILSIFGNFKSQEQTKLLIWKPKYTLTKPNQDSVPNYTKLYIAQFIIMIYYTIILLRALCGQTREIELIGNCNRSILLKSDLKKPFLLALFLLTLNSQTVKILRNKFFIMYKVLI